jgi:hypothetical protein
MIFQGYLILIIFSNTTKLIYIKNMDFWILSLPQIDLGNLLRLIFSVIFLNLMDILLS